MCQGKNCGRRAAEGMDVVPSSTHRFEPLDLRLGEGQLLQEVKERIEIGENEEERRDPSVLGPPKRLLERLPLHPPRQHLRASEARREAAGDIALLPGVNGIRDGKAEAISAQGGAAMSSKVVLKRHNTADLSAPAFLSELLRPVARR